MIVKLVICSIYIHKLKEKEGGRGMRKKATQIKVINVNSPTEKEAKEKIKQLNEYLAKNWDTPLERIRKK